MKGETTLNPVTHTTAAFQRSYDVVPTLWTLYRRRNNVVFVLGNYFHSVWKYLWSPFRSSSRLNLNYTKFRWHQSSVVKQLILNAYNYSTAQYLWPPFVFLAWNTGLFQLMSTGSQLITSRFWTFDFEHLVVNICVNFLNKEVKLRPILRPTFFSRSGKVIFSHKRMFWNG